MKTQKFYQICDRIRPDANGCHNWPGVKGKITPGKYSSVGVSLILVKKGWYVDTGPFFVSHQKSVFESPTCLEGL